MIKRKTFFFSFRHYVQYAIVTEKEIWFLLNHYFDYAAIMKKLFFISLGRSLWKYLLTWSFIAHYITNLLKKFPDGIVPGKSMCNLKNFFLRNFSGVLHDLLQKFQVNIKVQLNTARVSRLSFRFLWLLRNTFQRLVVYLLTIASIMSMLNW